MPYGTGTYGTKVGRPPKKKKEASQEASKAMKGQTHGGKGSATRKTDSAKFASNWDAIYNKPAKKSSKKANKA